MDGDGTGGSGIEFLEEIGQLVDSGRLIVNFGFERVDEPVSQTGEFYGQVVEMVG